ncbi:beta-lactamase/D-alanine carboxypeptidase [Nocardia farcinica]|uniref:Beta-lactamase/D-alanine carboxypeptidase n=1 Tax=Nocardia farcinica TaxID=37329 RepID=A0A449H7J2_NOCFR|nr:serine hydrolase [Nocardia farcinica]VFA93661.1 beta-lactamase/D-alanine carboxypeptidase [Nocardia farcinica]
MVRGVVAAMAAVTLVAGALAGAAQAAPDPGYAECAVTSGRTPQRAAPEAAGFDSGRLDEALRFAAERNRFNVQVFRHNCLVGEGRNNGHTGHVPWNIWSSTKSVVSLLAGMAAERGLLDLHAPIDRYLPAGLGDAEHRSITVENLLTETSGMRVGVLTEGITGVIPIDPHSAVQALGVPLANPPGTVFSYSQRNVDLLAYVIELALGEPLQQFAQRELFDPLGIAREDYYWARDRAGNTYGYAHLMLPPDDFAKLGLLVADDGRWGAQQIVPADYLRQARTPSPANRCYGYLFWLGPGCAEIPAFLPSGVYAMAGLGLQNVFVLPELDLVVVWTGAFGNVSAHGVQGIVQNTGELPWEFFRKLFAAMHEPPVPDPGPYVEPPLRTDPSRYVDNSLLLAVFGVGPAAYPGCNVFSCLNYELAAPFADAPPGCYVLTCLGPDPRTPGIR